MTTRSQKASSKKTERNDGKHYEQLVENVIHGLLKLEGDGFQNVRVDRDVQLNAITKTAQGKPIKRQIDVLWEFTFGGITYRTVIQAKDWNYKISLGTVDTFANVLSDLPGHPRGIMITKSGCQKGALEYAKAHGIEIYHLGEADSALWGGTVPTLDGTFSLLKVSTTQVRLYTEGTLSPEALERWRAAISLPENEIAIFDDVGRNAGTAEDLKKSCLNLHKLTPGTNEVTAETTQPLFVHTSTGERFKLEGIKVTVQNEELVPPTKVYLTISHVLQLATGDATYTVDNNYTVRRLGDPLVVQLYRHPSLDS